MFGGVGTAHHTVLVIVGKSAHVAALIAVPLPFNIPVIVVDNVICGVLVSSATDHANPFADTTDTFVTVPVPATTCHVPSSLRNLVPVRVKLGISVSLSQSIKLLFGILFNDISLYDNI